MAAAPAGLLAPIGLQAAATALAVPSAAEGRSSLGVGDRGLPQHSLAPECRGCTTTRCLPASLIGGIEERAANGCLSLGMLEPEATAVNVVPGGLIFGVEGGERILSPEFARAKRWGLGEVVRQARPPPMMASLADEQAAALRRACAPESGVGTKLGSKAILLLIGGGKAPAPFTPPLSAAEARSLEAGGGGVWL